MKVKINFMFSEDKVKCLTETVVADSDEVYELVVKRLKGFKKPNEVKVVDIDILVLNTRAILSSSHWYYYYGKWYELQWDGCFRFGPEWDYNNWIENEDEA